VTTERVINSAVGHPSGPVELIILLRSDHQNLEAALQEFIREEMPEILTSVFLDPPF
jgi:hypothetical protein